MARKKMVTIKLTQEQARELWLSINGWCEAANAPDDMSDDERCALEEVISQIESQK